VNSFSSSTHRLCISHLTLCNHAPATTFSLQPHRAATMLLRPPSRRLWLFVAPSFRRSCISLCTVHLHRRCHHVALATVASHSLVHCTSFSCTSISCTTISCTSFPVFRQLSCGRSSKVNFQRVFVSFSVLYILIFNFDYCEY